MITQRPIRASDSFCASSTRRARQRRARLAALAGGLICISLAAAATAAPYNPDQLPGDEIGAIGQVCANVLRLEPNEEQYASCVDSLSASTRDLGRVRQLWRAQSDCLGEGRRANSPGLAECELARSNVGDGASDVDAAAPSSTKSYFYASSSEVHRREETACARLGLDPTSGAFGSCVTNLQSSLFEADNPL